MANVENIMLNLVNIVVNIAMTGNSVRYNVMANMENIMLNLENIVMNIAMTSFKLEGIHIDESVSKLSVKLNKRFADVFFMF